MSPMGGRVLACDRPPGLVTEQPILVMSGRRGQRFTKNSREDWNRRSLGRHDRRAPCGRSKKDHRRRRNSRVHYRSRIRVLPQQGECPWGTPSTPSRRSPLTTGSSTRRVRSVGPVERGARAVLPNLRLAQVAVRMTGAVPSSPTTTGDRIRVSVTTSWRRQPRPSIDCYQPPRMRLNWLWLMGVKMKRMNYQTPHSDSIARKG